MKIIKDSKTALALTKIIFYKRNPAKVYFILKKY